MFVRCQSGRYPLALDIQSGSQIKYKKGKDRADTDMLGHTKCHTVLQNSNYHSVLQQLLYCVTFTVTLCDTNYYSVLELL